MRKHWLIINLLALLIAAMQIFLQRSEVGRQLEFQLSSLWFGRRGVVAAPADVVIISLDHESYLRLGASPIKPWPRALVVELIRKLEIYGTRKVVFDFVIRGESTDSAADRELAHALGDIPTVIASDAIPLGAGSDGQVENLQPDPQFAASAGSLARITLPLDWGVARRFRLTSDRDRSELPTLAEAAVEMPEASDPKFLINYYGPAGSIRTVSFYQVLQENLAPELFRDKIVFVGYGLIAGASDHPRDSFITPFSGPLSFGVEIHATAAANLLHKSYIRRASPKQEDRLIALVVFILSLLVLSRRPQWGALILAAATTGWAVISYQAFLRGYFVPGLTAALLVMPFVLLTSAIYYYVVVHRSRQYVREALSRYVSPEIAERIVNDPTCNSYETESRVEVTMLFTDIRGFTSWAECNGNKEVLSTLNRYFSEIAAIVLDSQGTVIKYAGDGMFALWGAPLTVDSASNRALQSALDIRRRVRELGESGVLPLFETRVGLHRGEVSVGNLGERRRFDYTAVGDGVNITSRLEGLNKQFGTGILLSEAVVSDLGGSYTCIKLGSVRLRGRAEAMTAYTLLEEKIRADVLERWLKSVELFEQERYAEAAGAFEFLAAQPGPFAVVAGQYMKALSSWSAGGGIKASLNIEEESESGIYLSGEPSWGLV